MENGVEAWDPIASEYVQEAMSNSEVYLNEHFGGRKLTNKVNNKFELEHDTLMDSSAEMGIILLNYYQTQVGVLKWMLELGKIEIITEVYMLASQLALPQEVHLEVVFHIFGYLKGHHNSRMVLDPKYPTPGMSMFQEHYWCGFYGDVR